MILNEHQAKVAASFLLFFWVGAAVVWLKRFTKKTGPRQPEYVRTKRGPKRIYDVPRVLCSKHVVEAKLTLGKMAIVDENNCDACALIKMIGRI